MPANVTPEYERAEQRYRQATGDDERVAALREMLSCIPKHKGTEKMQADIKHRLSEARCELQKSGQSKGPDPFHIPKSGAGQVVLVGFPNAGKSSLLAATTHAEARVADYPFTTTVPQPGMWHREDVQIELVDTPPLTGTHVPAGLMGTIHAADVVCVLAEAGTAAIEQLDTVLAVLGDRGLKLRSVPRNELKTGDPSQRSGLLTLNKAELVAPATIKAVQDRYAERLAVMAVSAHARQGLDEWFQQLWKLLAMLRVYAKQPGQPADLQKPFTLPVGATVLDLARLIHRDLSETMKFARLWGHGRFEGQQVHKTEPLKDRDIVEIHE